MDLIPKPDQVVSAVGNVAQRVLHGGLADLRPMPRTLIDEGPLREVYRYDEPDGEQHPAAQGDPVLLVSPLAAPPLCYDLRRGCSLVEHLVGDGRPTFLVEYGEVSFKDRDLGLEPWVVDAVPAAIRAVSEHADGRPVHVVGWSMGGAFALLAAAGDPGLPIASITAVGAPFELREVPIVAPMRPLLSLADTGGPLGLLYQTGARQPLVRWATRLSPFQSLVTKPLALATHLDDADYLAQVEAVDHLTGQMSAYPGRTFGQLYHRLLAGHGLADGTFDLRGRTLSVADVTAPVLVVSGASDTIAPVGSVKASVRLLTGSSEARFEIVPGGHLGAITGRRARTSTWPVLGEWIDQWTGVAAPAASPAPRATTRRTAKKAAPRKATAKTATPKKAAPRKAATKKATTQKATKKAAPMQTATPGSESGSTEIGTNPTRRYGSGSSRALGR